MSDNTNKLVIEQLENYRKNKRLIALLNYELEHPAYASDQDIIDSMNYGRGDHEGSSGGNISDKTLYIALNYHERADSANAETIKDIAGQLYTLTQQQKRLDTYIGMMEKEDAQIISMTYIAGMNNDAISKALGISQRTVSTRRRRAINNLCSMFEFTKTLWQE